ncbi:pyrimidine dimer DNA glycosylase/endonuclease V [Halococcus thailandensis]|nr:pyrimidine dimer DNA glycosylase/endonuclease V [Halococcus thailandensis]
MTRMWCLPTEILCDDHLRGEHAEHHQLVGTIRNHPHGEAIAEGHAEKGNIDTTRLEERHARLAAEMERRDMNHDSPLAYDGPIYGAGAIDPEMNRTDLLDRCEDCAARARKHSRSQ